MNSWHTFLLLWGFISLLLLVACARGEQGAVVETAVATPQPTMQPTATETAIAVSAVEETTAPIPALPTEIPTPLGPLAEVIDLQTLPEVPVDSSTTYSLKTPDYDLLRDWLRAARNTPDKSSYYHIFDLLAFDFARSFPNGAGQLEPIYQENEYPGSFLAERLTWPVLETAVVAYLNQNQINLKDGSPINILELTLKPHAVDLNSDSIEEWLVEVDSKELSIFGVIPLTVEQPGQYAILPNTIEPINTSNTSVYTNGVAQVVYDFDFTGDKTIDVLQAAQGYLGGPFGYINIYIWNGSGLFLLEKIDISVPSFKPYASFEVGDFTHDGVPDVKVTTPHEVNFNCIWDEIDIYSWNGRTPHHLLTEPKTPDTPYCAMFHAITPVNRYSEDVRGEKSRVELLEAALSQITLETAPNTDYPALGYLHLAMAYLEQNDLTGAQHAFNQLYNLPEEALFAQLVQALYAENGGDMLDVCQQLYTSPGMAEETGISDYIYAGSITGFFGIGSEQINADAICPFPKLTRERLTALSLPTSQHPETSLAQYGYNFSHYETANLDGDPETEWLGLVEKEYLFLTVLDQMDGRLKPIVLTTTCLECEDGFEYEIRAGDRYAYVIGRLNKNVQCSNDGPIFMLPQPFLVQHEQGQFDFDTIFTFCDAVDERPLAEISAADFDPAPTYFRSWYSALYEATGKHYLEWMDELQTAVLTQTDPTVPAKIAELLAYLPDDDPEAQPYVEQLTYLLGYHYELNGDEENAVSTYLDLIQRFPASPWSWLAWARLEPVDK